MKMKRNVLLAIAGIALLFLCACNNPFLYIPPEKKPGTPPADSPVTVNVAVPVIAVQPQGATYHVGAQAQALTVSASVSDGGTLSYQWYSNAGNSNENGTIISGGTGARYTPPTATLGVMYYYVVVTNTLNKKTAAITSNTAQIEVNDKVNAQ